MNPNPKRLIVVLSCLVAWQFSGWQCLRAQQPDYFPTPVVGSLREFSFELKSGGKSQKGTLKISTDQEVEIEGKKYVKMISDVEGGPEIAEDAQYVRFAKEGMFVIEGQFMKFPEYREIPFPIALEKEWTFLSARGPVHGKAEFEDVKLGKRTFKRCLKISETLEEKDGGKTVVKTWYASNLGEVKIAMSDGQSTIEALLLKPLPK